MNTTKKGTTITDVPFFDYFYIAKTGCIITVTIPLMEHQHYP